MEALAFWKAVTMDRTDFLERVIALLRENGIRFCVVGGQAVNALLNLSSSKCENSRTASM